MASRRRVLVCGATGFIGRNLVETLARQPDLEVHALRHIAPAYEVPGVRWRHADLLKQADVSTAVQGMDVVVQAAATTSGVRDIVNSPHIHVTDNAVMNSLLLRECHEAKVGHFVFFSCSVMYGARDRPWREDEWDAGQALHPSYFGAGWTKVYIERMCEFFAGLGVTRHTVIRHTNVYGPHDKFDLERSHVMAATITKALSGTDGTLRVWGDGSEARDLIYVGDLVRFVELAIRNQTASYELLHASSGRAVQVRHLVEAVIAASGRSLAVEYDTTKPTIKTSFALDSGRALERLGWKAEVTMEEGIARTIRWWRETLGAGKLP